MPQRPYSRKDSSTWHLRFKKDDLQWADLDHMGSILVPMILLLFSVVLYPVIFIWLNLSTDTSSLPLESSRFEPVLFIIKLFTPILIPLIVAVFALKILGKQSEQVIRAFYNLPQDYNLAPHIKRRLLGVLPMPDLLKKLFKYPFITLTEVQDLESDHWARWFGGPATLVIYDGVAVYVERGNQFSRVLGPGLPMPVLERYETIREVVDLRPQVRDTEVVAWTKDGIEVKCEVKAQVQIASSEAARQNSVVIEENQNAINLIYPFDPDAVKTVVERTAVRFNEKTGELSESAWDGAAIGTVTGKIKAYIAAHALDELALESPNSPQLLSFDISTELSENITAGLSAAGAQLLSLQITNFAPLNDDILKKLVDYWNAEKEKIKKIREGENESQSIRAKQSAYTKAYQEFLNTLIDNLQEMNQASNTNLDTASFTETSVLLLTEVLEQSLSDPLLGSFIAKEGLSTLEMLKKQLNI